jgi:Antirepressor regulating drug resistance, predicted signal transduction N-terminal membrane component
MLASPIVTTLIIKRGIVQTPPAPAQEVTQASASTSWKAEATTTAARESAASQAPASWTAMPDAAQPAVDERMALRQKLAKALPWLVSIWLAGVLVLSLRVLGGWVMAQRLKNWKTTPATIKWQQTVELLARRLKVSRTVRLCESVVAEVPTVVGWLRPVILVPVSAFTGLSPQQIEALLSHELAHIRRHDYLINLLQTAIETLLFYHPAVWWVSKQIRTEREHCCDDLAVATCGNVLTYARALAELEQLRGHKALPELAVAADGGGSLLGRIQRLIGAPASPHQRSSAWIASLVAIATIFSICVGARSAIFESDAKRDEAHRARTAFGKALFEGAFGFTYEQQSAPANSQTVLQRGINESVMVVGDAPQDDEDLQDGTTPPPTPGAPTAPPAPPSPLSPIVLQPTTPAPIISITPRAFVYTPSAPSAPFSFTPTPAAPPAPRTFSYAPTPTPGAPVAPRAMQDEEDAEDKPSGSYIDGMVEAGYTNLSVDELIKLRDHGVTPNFLKELKALGYGLPPVEMAIRLADHGVRISYIKKLADMGYKKLSFEELIRAADHGVRPEIIEALGAAGYKNLSLEQIIRTQDHGVGPTYIKQMAEVGFSNLSLDLLIRMRDHGVGPEYVKEIRAMGYSNISAEQFIRLRDHGVSAAFMRKARERGFNNLSLDELIKLRDADIL